MELDLFFESNFSALFFDTPSGHISVRFSRVFHFRNKSVVGLAAFINFVRIAFDEFSFIQFQNSPVQHIEHNVFSAVLINSNLTKISVKSCTRFKSNAIFDFQRFHIKIDLSDSLAAQQDTTSDQSAGRADEFA